ncbi:MAG: patatin family protein [Ruminococcus sp.]|nr:patatin family protein [Ruminococcus sp.]
MLGIIAEGGASRTVYTAGVMDALLDLGIYADYFIGVSAGIAFGVSYCSNQSGRNKALVTDYMWTNEYSGIRHLFRPSNRSFYNLDYVFGKVPNELLPFDFDAFASFKGKCISVMTDLETGQPYYPDTPRNDPKLTHLRASCALPILFPPIEIDGRLYMDGGISDSLPFNQAIMDGCDKIIVILTRERGFQKTDEPTEKLIKRAYRQYPEFVEMFCSRAKRYNESMAELERLRASGKAFVFNPKKELLVKRTDNDPDKLLRLYDYGYKHTMWAKDALNRYLSR